MQKMQNKRLIQRIWVSFLAMGLMLLVGCQAKPQGLTPDQIAALQEQGFKLTDNGWEFGLANKVLFDSDVKKLNSEGMQTVQKIGRILSDVGIKHMRVDGHTDSVGRGKLEPVADNRTSKGRAENRRVAIIITAS